MYGPSLRRILVLLPLLLGVAGAARAQGSARDYERAWALRERLRDTVVGEDLVHGWSPDGARLWFEERSAARGRRFRVVDVGGGPPVDAFDHEALAAAMRDLHLEVDAGELPVRRLAFAADRGLRLLLVGELPREARVGADGRLVEIGDVDPQGPFAIPLEERGRNRSSWRRSSARVELVFVNRTATAVFVDGIAGRGEGEPLEPGASRARRSRVGQLWRVVELAGGEDLGEVVAPRDGGVVLIDGPAPPAEEARAQEEGRDPTPTPSIRFRDHDAFLRRPAGDELRLTNDGVAGAAYRGPVEFAPDGRHVVLMHRVEGAGREISFVESSPRDQLQPKLHTFEYAKPGDELDVTTPRMFDVETGREVPLDTSLFPDPWRTSDGHWSADGTRYYFVHNQRGHRVVRLVEVDVRTHTTRVLIDEQPATFFDYNEKLFVHHLEATDEALWTSERSGWNHLWRVDRATGAATPVTAGEWVVRAVEDVDEERRRARLRVMGYHPGQDPYHVHFAHVDLDDGTLVPLTASDGTHEISFAPDGEHLVATWSRVDQPPVHELRRVADGALVAELARADASRALEELKRFPEPFVAKGRDGETDIHGVIYRPTHLHGDFDPSRSYPVIEAIYAGPHDAHVPKSFRAYRGVQALAELGFVVVQIDGMGTNWRSKAFHDVAWKNLADAGFPDRIAWLRAAGARYPWMDLERVGIYGGSAGGQNAMRAVLDHHDFYSAAAADCGCHDNRMDKVWWNELWMSWPVDEGYAASSNVEHADRLGGALLLTVGEKDTNVDPASTMQVVDALIRADKDFELIVFPGRGHGAGGSRYGLRRMYDFFVRELHGVEPRWETEPTRTVRRQQNR